MQGGNSGISDVVNRVKEKARECPNMKFALVGYSQGGMVVSSAFGKIPIDLHPKVVAMVLYGSGKGDVSKSTEISQKTLANCAPNDMVSFNGWLKRFYLLTPLQCGTPSGAAGHFTYGSTGTSWHTRSAQYIASAFHGRPQGYKLYLSPR